MFLRKLLRFSNVAYTVKNSPPNNAMKNLNQSLHVSAMKNDSEKKNKENQIVHRDAFKEVRDKNRNTYLEMVKIFINNNNVYRRGHVEFIYSALKNMEEFGVHKDIEVYKALIDVLPKGKFIPTNIIQAEFMHYPKQQQCIIDLLEQMEDNGVMPDIEMESLLLNVFGKKGFPLRKYWRMMYWMPKFKNLSPWPVPDPLPKDTYDLAKYAIERISSVDVNSIVTVYQSADIKDSIDDTWIVSAQSKTQKKLVDELKENDPVYVEGSFKVWIKGNPINYFILRGKPTPIVDEEIDIDDVSKIKISSIFNFSPPSQKHLRIMPSVHEQEDGIIFSVCATGTSTKDSLLSWVRHLENDGNPNLGKVPIVFTLRSGTREIANVYSDEEKMEKIDEK